MRNKIFCVLLLSALLCTPANADLLYTYTNSSTGSCDVGLIDVTKTESGSFNLTPVKDAVSDLTFNKIHVSGYKKNNSSYAIIAEHPVTPDNTTNSVDIAYIYNYDQSGNWNLEKSFEMTGAVNVRKVIISGNGDSLFAAAHGLDDQTVNSGVVEYYIPSNYAKRNSYVYSVKDGSVVHGEDLFIHDNRIHTLFSVKSGDTWLQSNVTRFYGQFTKENNTRLNPQAVDFTFANNQVVAACMGNYNASGDVISGEVSLWGNGFVTLVSADNDGNSIGKVLAVNRDNGSGFYFIAEKNNVETLYYCTTTNRTDDIFSVISVDTVTPSSSSYVSSERDILWDDDNKLVFIMTGDKIIIINCNTDEEGYYTVLKTYTYSDLGGYPSSISLITDSSSPSSKKNNRGCNSLYLGLIALIVPAVCAVKFKIKNKK